MQRPRKSVQLDGRARRRRTGVMAPQVKGAPRPQRPSFYKRPIFWIFGVVVAAIASMITGAISGVATELFDQPAAKDPFRLYDELRIVTDIVHDNDQGYSVAIAGVHEPTPDQRMLMTVIDAGKAQELAKQLRTAGGADLSKLSIRVLLEGRRNQEIRIVDIAPVELKQEPPVSGTLFYIPPQAGAPNLQMLFNMDEKFPRAREVGGPSGASGGFFEKTSISLKDKEQVVLSIRATTTKYSATFRLKATYYIGAEEKFVTLDNKGQPFRVTAVRCNPTVAGVASYDRVYNIGPGMTVSSPAENPRSFQMNNCGT